MGASLPSTLRVRASPHFASRSRAARTTGRRDSSFASSGGRLRRRRNGEPRSFAPRGRSPTRRGVSRRARFACANRARRIYSYSCGAPPPRSVAKGLPGLAFGESSFGRGRPAEIPPVVRSTTSRSDARGGSNAKRSRGTQSPLAQTKQGVACLQIPNAPAYRSFTSRENTA